jgi:hypothetical protein
MQPVQRDSAGDGGRVLVLEPDAQRRDQLARACEGAGFTVTAVARIAEIERWPDGDVVVGGAEHFSEMWKRLGAAHVIVLSNTPSEGIDACTRGAAAWIPRLCSPEALIAILVSVNRGEAV